jgi:CheY-like chemotaxis protein
MTQSTSASASAAPMFPALPTTHCAPLSVRPRIVIAEDDAEMRQSLLDALGEDDYELTEVDSGIALCELLRSAKRLSELPSLIISDVRMPGLNGLAVVQAVRSWGWRIPIVLITAYATEQMLNEAFQLGATALLCKPFELEDLRSAIACLLPGQSVDAAPEL